MAITNCNKLVTLGILDTFTSGLIQDANGNTVSVNYGGKPSTYCPTYTELTNGTYLPKHEDGTDPNSDVDGIEITGTYAPNENVRSMDLVVKYTRYSGLTITANPTEFHVSGGTSILNYDLEFNRFEQTYSGTNCDSTAETSTSVSDTSLTIDWEQTPIIGDIVYPNFIISGVPSASTATLEAKVTFRDTEEVCQLPTTFTFTGSHCSCDDFVLLNTPSAFTSANTAQYVYYDAGDCITVNRVSGATHFSRTIDRPNNRIRFSVNAGYTGNCRQSRSETATICYSGEDGCSSAVTVDLYKESTCCCDCAFYFIDSTGHEYSSYAWDYDSTSAINYAIYPYGDCISGDPYDVTAYNVTCDNPHWTVIVQKSGPYVEFVATPTSTNMGASTIEGDVIVKYNLVEENPTGGCEKRFHLIHRSQACDCSNFEFTSTPTPFPAGTAVPNYAEYYSGPCISATDVSASESWIDTSFVDGQKKVAVICDPQPSGKLSRSGTVTVEYESTGDTTCSSSATFNVSQVSSCNCDEAIDTVIPIPFIWDSSALHGLMIGVDVYECFKSSGTTYGFLNLYTACTSNHWTITQIYNPTGSTAFSIAPVSANTANTDIDDIFSIYYDLVENNPAGGCSKSFPLKHKGIDCTCGDFGLVNSPTAITSGGGPIQYINYTAGTCITATSVTASNTWIKTSLDTTNKRIALSASSMSCKLARSGTVTVNYSGPSCTSAVTFNVTQNSSCDCDCIGSISTNYTWDSTATTTTTLYLHTSMPCFTSPVTHTISGPGRNHWNVSKILDATGETQVYITPTSVNDSFDDIQAILTLNYPKAEGTTCTKTLTLTHSGKPCTCSDFEVSQPDTVPSTGSSNIVVYFDKCPSITVNNNVTTSAFWLHFAGITGSAMYFTANSQPAPDQPSRSGTATVNYSTPSCTSSATITFRQESNFNCQTVSSSTYANIPSSIGWAANNTSVSRVSFGILNQINALDYSSLMASVTNDHFSASVVTGSPIPGVNVEVAPKAINDTYNDKNANLIVYYNLKENNPVGGCELIIPIKHSGKTCDTSSFEFGTIPTIPSSGCTYDDDLKVPLNYGPCIEIDSITSNQTWLNASFDGTEISYTDAVVFSASSISSCLSKQGAIVTVSYHDTVTMIYSAATFIVTEEGTCKCGCALQYDNDPNWDIWGDSDTSIHNVYLGCKNGPTNQCFDGNNLPGKLTLDKTEASHWNISITTGGTTSIDPYKATILIQPKTKNTSSSDINGTFYLNYTLKDGTTCRSTFNIVQFGVGCTCQFFEWI